MKAQIYDIQGNEKGSIELNDSVFNIKPNRNAIHYALKAELANARQGNSSTKGRGEVQGSGAKPWRQKGTGRARAGCKRSPLWKGGGIVFGPKPREYGVRLMKKVKKLSIKSILSMKANDNSLKVMEDFAIESGKTRDFGAMAERLVAQERRKRVLFVDRELKPLNRRAGRNIPWVKYFGADLLNTRDLFYATQLVLTESAVQALNEKYSDAMRAAK
jgi:large subunit ribosomal protein L4